MLLGIATRDLTSNSLFNEKMFLAKRVTKTNCKIKIYLFLAIMLYLMSDLFLPRDKDKFFLKSTIACIALLIGIHIYLSIPLFDSSSKMFGLLHIVIILILMVMLLAILLKGVVPVAISSLGLVLLYGSILIPSATSNSLGPFYYKAGVGNLHYETLVRAAHGFFLLGLAMVVLGFIVAYKPSFLYTRNRPQSAEHLWANYPKWEENRQLVSTRTEALIDLPNLLNEKEKYLLWRYEFILVIIYGTTYKVPIYSFVPESSSILREPKSHQIVGMSKYGYFV